MTVVAYPKDVIGIQLTAASATLATQIANTSSTALKASLAAALNQNQLELVLHFLEVGRLIPANILTQCS